MKAGLIESLQHSLKRLLSGLRNLPFLVLYCCVLLLGLAAGTLLASYLTPQVSHAGPQYFHPSLMLYTCKELEGMTAVCDFCSFTHALDCSNVLALYCVSLRPNILKPSSSSNHANKGLQ